METGKQDRPFIREHIIPSKRKKRQDFLKALGRMFLYGAVFGAAAGLFFVITSNFLRKEAEVSEYGQQEKEEFKTDAYDNADVLDGNESLQKDENQKQDMEEEHKETTDQGNADKKDSKTNQVSGVQKKISKWNQSIVAVYAQSEWLSGQSTKEHGFGIAVAKDEDLLYFLMEYQMLPSDTNNLRVQFFDGAVLSAKLVGKDEVVNLAVIGVKLEEIPKSILEKAEVIKMGDVGQLQPGCDVFLLGCPNGFLYSVDAGMISGMQEKAYVMDYSLDVYPTNIRRHENTSGLVLSTNGKLLGMITSSEKTKFDEEIVVFSGIWSLKRVINKILERQPLIYCGICAEDIPQQKRMSMGITNGIYVTEILPNSPAAQAGIRAGDIIQKIEDTEISTLIDFYTKISEYDHHAQVDMYAVRVSSDKKKENKYIVRLREKE